MFIETLISDPLFFVRAIAIVVLSICLHELAHGWAAIYQGDDTPLVTEHITLNPVTHMGWPSLVFLCLCGLAWGAMPVNPAKFRSRYGEAFVAAAGPATNLVLALVCTAIASVILRQSVTFLSADFFLAAAHINLMLFAFNLLPIPPLDGFHVLATFVPDIKWMETSGYGMAALMVLFISGFGTGLSKVTAIVLKHLL